MEANDFVDYYKNLVFISDTSVIFARSLEELNGLKLLYILLENEQDRRNFIEKQLKINNPDISITKICIDNAINDLENNIFEIYSTKKYLIIIKKLLKGVCNEKLFRTN